MPELPRLAIVALLCTTLTGRGGSAMGIRKDRKLLARSADGAGLFEALGAELTRRGIAGVTVHPERCRAKDRDGLVVVAARPR